VALWSAVVLVLAVIALIGVIIDVLLKLGVAQ